MTRRATRTWPKPEFDQRRRQSGSEEVEPLAAERRGHRLHPPSRRLPPLRPMDAVVLFGGLVGRAAERLMGAPPRAEDRLLLAEEREDVEGHVREER